MKVKEFINLRQRNMSLEEYSLKFTMFSRYAPSLVSNPRYEMNRFVIDVADLVNEECRKAMLHNDMNLSRPIMYAQSIENSKHSRISRNLKMIWSIEKNQPKFKNKAPMHDGPISLKVKLQCGIGS